MSSFKLFRIICRIVGIILGFVILISFIADWRLCARVGVILLVIDLILIAVKNRRQ